MIKNLQENVRFMKDMESLIQELNHGCEETVASIKRNGYILDEFKENDFRQLSLNKD